jgi:hypothetical protein
MVFGVRFALDYRDPTPSASSRRAIARPGASAARVEVLEQIERALDVDAHRGGQPEAARVLPIGDTLTGTG